MIATKVPTSAPTQAKCLALEAKHIDKVFGDESTAIQVLFEVSATIECGEFVALMGPSGSGKSTFLSIAGTLLSPSRGEVCIAGIATTGLSQEELGRLRNRHLGFVFQFHHLLPDFSAIDNVLMPVYGQQHHIDRISRTRAEGLLERVGLLERKDSRASELSGGQKQRVAVARALIMKPDLVLADEPTGNLDRASSNEVMALLEQLSQEEGTAFLISTHDRSIADRCRRILLMEDGRFTRSVGADAGSGQKAR